MRRDEVMRYTIIGNSAAAVSAVEAIRGLDKNGEIVVISKEPHLAYSRPLITEYVAGAIADSRMSYRSEQFYRDNNVELCLGLRAEAVDIKNKVVLAEGKKKFSYDRLLIATGGAPINPPLKGNVKKGIFNLNTWDDAKDIKKYIKGAKRGIVIGGGLIGMKTAEGLHEAGLKVTVVELAPRILSRILNKEGSAIFEDYLKGKGMEIISEDTVEKVLGSKKVEGALLKSGAKVKGDILVMAIGVRPNLTVIDKSGIEVNQGILVNERMRASVPDVYAAGDVAEAYDLLAKDRRVNAIWPLAVRQGRVAGNNMAGGDKIYKGGFSMNSLQVLGLPTISAGIIDPPERDGYQVLRRIEPDKRVYKKLVFKEDIIIGAVFINDIDRAGIITGLIAEGTLIEKKERLLEERLGVLLLDRDWRNERLTKPV